MKGIHIFYFFLIIRTISMQFVTIVYGDVALYYLNCFKQQLHSIFVKENYRY